MEIIFSYLSHSFLLDKTSLSWSHQIFASHIKLWFSSGSLCIWQLYVTPLLALFLEHMGPSSSLLLRDDYSSSSIFHLEYLPRQIIQMADWIGLSNAPYSHIFPKDLLGLQLRICPACKIHYFVVTLPFAVAIHYPCPNFSFHSTRGTNLISELLTHTEDPYLLRNPSSTENISFGNIFFSFHIKYIHQQTLLAQKCSDNFLLNNVI